MTTHLPAGFDKPHKYLAKRTKVDGVNFPSKAEANRWSELRLLERQGKISDLRRQVKIPLTVNGKLVCTYIADFVYIENSEQITEDSKGVITKDFAIKAKLFAAIYGKDIRISGKGHDGWVQRRNMAKRESAA